MFECLEYDDIEVGLDSFGDPLLHMPGSDKPMLHESLWVNWAYLANMDSGNLEVYVGGNPNKYSWGRYAEFKNEENSHGYYGVSLIKEFSFKRIKSLRKNLSILVREMDDAAMPFHYIAYQHSMTVVKPKGNKTTD